MADLKITQLTALTTPVLTDVLPIVDDPTGTPVTKKVALSYILNGWLSFGETITYVSATSFTIVGNYTSYFKIGTKFKCVNVTNKYGYISSSTYLAPNTTVNLIPNNDYPLADAAITGLAISYSNPADFPAYFNYTPTWTASVTNPTIGNGSIDGLFSITNRILIARIIIVMGSTTTYGSGTYYFGSPVPMVSQLPSVVTAADSGTTYRTGVAVYATNTKVSVFSDAIGNSWGNTVPHTWAVNDNIRLSIESTI